VAVTSPRATSTVRSAAALLTAALLLTTGCTAGAPTVPASTAPASPSASANNGLAGPVNPSDAPPRDITLAFAGDVHFAERTADLLAKDPSTAFGPVAAVLSDADITMVNMETAVTERGTAEPKQWHFRAPATAFDAIRAAGVDVVTVANNHALDYGPVGFADTLDAARARNFPTVGGGANAAQAYAPWVTTVRGTRIAYLGFSQIHELEYTWAARDDRAGIAMAVEVARARAAVVAARAIADIVVVYVHWGQEGNSCPTPEMKNFAQAMADAGATIVLGTHAHLLLGEGWLGKTYVDYGMGNFLWWYNDAYSNDTGVVKITIRDKAVVGTQFIPAVISYTTGQPIPAEGAEAARISRKLAGLRGCTGLAVGPG